MSQNSINVKRTKRPLRRVRRLVLILVCLLFAIVTIGSDTIGPAERQNRSIARIFAGWEFDLIGWELQALGEKAESLYQRPAADLNEADAVRLVQRYLENASEIARIEADLRRVMAAKDSREDDKEASLSGDNLSGSEQEDVSAANLTHLQDELDRLRTQQDEMRPAVEQIIQRQISQALVAEGLSIANYAFPPVLFGFTEPPKKLIVSPRDQIETRYAQMLASDVPLETIAQSEGRIYEEHDLSAYVTSIGGLGAYPTMVIDRASLGWVLSTVAHEWVHNYLTLFPLGINYATSSELTIINETVAEIVGNEIGMRVAERFYPESIAPTPVPETKQDESAATASDASSDVNAGETSEKSTATERFDFRAEMRNTRIQVDNLLAEGKVEEAEQYMEQRRLEFVEEGYNLRVLNQAYFAFHGSYGTSAASTSTIGPKLEELRQRTSSLRDFLVTVRTVTSEKDIDEALTSAASQ